MRAGREFSAEVTGASIPEEAVGMEGAVLCGGGWLFATL
jgi:hypothetical protein